MQKQTAYRLPQDARAAFTLIEMMVVVALIGILIGGVFRLMSASGENTKRAKTVDRLQRLENALSGFYAEYGTYPPVEKRGTSDPYKKNKDDGSVEDAGGLYSDNATKAARSQPMSFQFPTPRSLDTYITQVRPGVYSANQNPSAFDKNSTDSNKNKLFVFGAMSFLLPRLEAIGDFRGGGSDSRPVEDFFNYALWKANNNSAKGSYKGQLETETSSCRRWMPNFEGIVYGGKTLIGVNTGEPIHGFPRLSDNYSQESGNLHCLGIMTIRDGWDNELFYYSAPPYQSYRIWSAGPNGVTFPPWIPLESLSEKERGEVNKWIKDDIARFDR